jgi:hypothetical protein
MNFLKISLIKKALAHDLSCRDAILGIVETLRAGRPRNRGSIPVGPLDLFLLQIVLYVGNAGCFPESKLAGA